MARMKSYSSGKFINVTMIYSFLRVMLTISFYRNGGVRETISFVRSNTTSANWKLFILMDAASSTKVYDKSRRSAHKISKSFEIFPVSSSKLYVLSLIIVIEL